MSKHWLVELSDYDKNIQQFIKTFNFRRINEDSMIAKHIRKVKEERQKTKNLSWTF